MYSVRRTFSAEQHFSDNMMNCVHNLDNRTFPASTEVICPAPRRPARVPYIVDGLDRSLHRPKSNLTMHNGDAGLEILDIYLSMNDRKDGLDRSNEAGFFCGSPPLRTNNPLVHDAQFGRQVQNQMFASPLGNCHGLKPPPPPSSSSSSRSPSCGVSFGGGGGSPRVRIEGFACGSSESQCIVQALA